MPISRRDILRAAGATTAALLASPLLAWSQQSPATQPNGKRILLFTRSQGFAHSVVTRKKKPDGTPVDDLAFAEKLVYEWGGAAGYNVTVTKDGSLFTPEIIAAHDVFVFYTDGDLTRPPANATCDKTPAMTQAGKDALLKAIAEGKGFLGLHSASATFQDKSRSNDPVRLVTKETKVDPYCAMLGAEFTSHGAEQKATIRAASKVFPGLGDLADYDMTEEWYAFTSMATDLHVLLVQDTATMRNARGGRDRQYQGDPYPATWARTHGMGRVFYTSMGHREDVWNNPLYKKILLASLAWTSGLTNAELKPNLAEACPKLAATLKN